MNKPNVRNILKVPHIRYNRTCSFDWQRFIYNLEKCILWKRYMPGWREVCDECYTTLFNYNYMCEQCGYMICIECFDQYAQLSLDKRKSCTRTKSTIIIEYVFIHLLILGLKRLCSHDKPFILSEFIPWPSKFIVRRFLSWACYHCLF
jgi:hypothetical protein